MTDDPVLEALDVAGDVAPKKRGAPVKKAKKGRSKAGSNYAAYAPEKFKRHPAAKVLNFSLQGAFDGSEPGKHEVGEAWTAAAYWAAGLPPYTPQDGDGHPYVVAADRTGRWLWPKLSKHDLMAAAKLMLKRQT